LRESRWSRQIFFWDRWKRMQPALSTNPEDVYWEVGNGEVAMEFVEGELWSCVRDNWGCCEWMDGYLKDLGALWVMHA
jgi:hypothetical protein